MENILITGCSGFIGSEITSKLVRTKKYKVYGLSRTKGYLPQDVLNSEYFTFIEADLTKDVSLDALSKINFEYLINTISIIAYASGKFNDYYTFNVLTQENILSNIRFTNYIYISTCSVYGNQEGVLNEASCISPIDYYGLSKYMAEQLANLSKIPRVVILRLSSVIGKNHKNGLVYSFYESLKKGEKLEVFSNGILKRNFIHVVDVADVIMNIVAKIENLSNREIFIVGAKNSIKMQELANILKKRLKSSSEIVPVSKVGKYSVDVELDVSKIEKLLGIKLKTCEEYLDIFLKEMEV